MTPAPRSPLVAGEEALPYARRVRACVREGDEAMRISMRATAIGTLACGALAFAGCGPAPYSIGPEDPAREGDAAQAEAPPAEVYVRRAEAAPAPPAREAEDRWIPDGLPRPNPFADYRTWVGEYYCPQGRTALTFRVVDVRGRRVRAIFDFHHAPTDTSGQYLMVGSFDDQTGTTTFVPGPWIVHPVGWVQVSMVGQVSRDESRFYGRIDSSGCGSFRLRVAM